jgi:hypothetical protein
VGGRTFDSYLRELTRLRAEGAEIFAVHYACQSIVGTPSAPPAVSAVAFQSLVRSEVVIYSQADRKKRTERFVLESYFAFLKRRAGCRLVHWRMHEPVFGFSSLANRYAHVLERDPPFSIPFERTFSLPEIIAAADGTTVDEVPKMLGLFELNGLATKHVLRGGDEADRLKRHEHAEVRASVAEKVTHLANLTNLMIDGNLETNRGGRRVQFSGALLDSVHVVCHIAHRLRIVQRQLAKRHSRRASISLNDEYDFQDLTHGLLRLFFDDVRAEKWTPDYAGGSSRIDFVLPVCRLGIELKHAKILTKKKVGDQLLIDIARYKKETSVRHLVCLVFDYEGKIANPRGLETDLSVPTEGMGVTVKIIGC